MLKHTLNKLFLLSGLSLLISACSNSTPQPQTKIDEKNCPAAHVETVDQDIFINLEKDLRKKVFILHNISLEPVLIDRVSLQQDMSAGWATQIDADHWSAVALELHNFGIHCTTVNSTTVLNCQDVLKVCQLTAAQIPESLAGSFWLTENQLENDVLPAIQARGISF